MLDISVSRQATVATVLTGMRHDILLGKYENMKQISELEVAQKYQVSRSSVRSAFQILERDGLLEAQPNGRKVLKKIDQKYIKDLCKTRSILECEAVQLILQKEKNDFSQLLHIVGQFYSVKQIDDKEEQRARVVQLNDDFHDRLFEMAGNCALSQCHYTLKPMVSSIMGINATLDLNMNEHDYYDSHHKITELLMAKDESVIEYIRYHTAVATMKDALIALNTLRNQ